jgi:hypothetical protein
MKHITRKSWFLALPVASLAFFAASPLSAAPPTVTLNLTGVNGNTLGGVFTSPYFGNINGGPTIPVICDDFIDDSYIPESWIAYVTQLSDISSESSTDTVLKWAGGWNGTGSASNSPLSSSQSLTQIQAYETAAILAVDILGSSGETQQEYSFAMWELFDPTDASAALPSVYQSTVATMINTAATAVTSGNLTAALNGASVTFYSFVPDVPGSPTCNGGPCPTAPPQEFVAVSMAEPWSPAVLGIDLLGVAALMLFVRRRTSASANSIQS